MTRKSEPLLDSSMSLNHKDEHKIIGSDGQLHTGPVDNGIAYLCMLLLGAGTLFPYNTMMTAGDWYESVWPGMDLMFIAPLAASIGTPFVQVILMKMQHRISFATALLYPFAIMTVLVILLPLMPIVVSNKDVSFALAILLILLTGFTSAVVQSTIFSLAALFPPNFMQAVMAGQGWSGVVVCAARVVTKATFSSDKTGDRNGALVFFAMSTVFTTVCIFVYLYLRAMPFARHHLARAGRDELARVALLDDAVSSSRAAADDALVLVEDPAAAVAAAEAEPVSFKSVISNLGFFPVHIICVFFMSFLVFPGLLTAPAPSFDISQGWFFLIMMCEFNAVDLLGRSLPSYVLLFTADTVWIGVYLRFLLYPLFFLAAHSSVFAASSFWPLAFGFVFALSNGYISSLVMMYAPSKVPPKERGAAGGVMSIALTSGILFGSLVALGVQKLVKLVD